MNNGNYYDWISNYVKGILYEEDFIFFYDKSDRKATATMLKNALKHNQDVLKKLKKLVMLLKIYFLVFDSIWMKNLLWKE